jgi:GNAT superfamily N-acetyltransferase
MSDTVQLFIEAWKAMVGRLPSPRIEEADGVATCFGNVPLVFLNLSIVDRPAASADDLRALLKTSAGRAGACEHPSGVVLCEDWLPAGWEQVTAEAGLAEMMGMTGMEGGKLLPPRRPQANVEIRRAIDDAGARDLAQLNAVAYHVPGELFECISGINFWHDDSLAYVGYVDGKPVSTASVLPVAGTVYVALVATLPEEQGKGYAETVMRHAVTQGQQAMGVMRTTLHATDMGQPVYRAMGYTPGPRLILFAPAH